MEKTEGMVSPGETGSETGNSGGAPDYAGYSTPEELASAHKNLASEKAALESRIKDLQAYQGRSGTEIGNLKTQLAAMQGQLQAYQTIQPQNTGPTIQDIKAKLDRGDITEADALEMVHKITLSQAESSIMKQYEARYNKDMTEFKNQVAFEKYKEKFLAENKGYSEAYESGKLDKWISQGMSGQAAWDKYQLEQKNAELEALKTQTAKAKEEAEKKGMEKGVKIEQGKAGASKVLNGKSTAFSQHQGNYDLSNPQQRRQAGIDKLNQIRTGAG